MAENSGCGGSCGSCSKDCAKRPTHETLHKDSKVKKVIGIVSGKGGVGKSLVTSLLACKTTRDGLKTAIMDADITGPSIPKAFGLNAERAQSGGTAESGFLYSVKSKTGIQMMSMNFLLPNENDPVVWRGPVISGAVKQFWTDVVWEDVDVMFVDCPPGTGDVPLTVFQSIPVDGIIIVTSPQELVSMVVTKAVNMAEKMNIPIIGIVENMSYLECPDCKKRINIFGESHIDEVAKEHNLTVLDRIPIDPKVASACDRGMIELANVEVLPNAIKAIENI